MPIARADDRKPPIGDLVTAHVLAVLFYMFLAWLAVMRAPAAASFNGNLVLMTIFVAAIALSVGLSSRLGSYRYTTFVWTAVGVGIFVAGLGYLLGLGSLPDSFAPLPRGKWLLAWTLIIFGTVAFLGNWRDYRRVLRDVAVIGIVGGTIGFLWAMYRQDFRLAAFCAVGAIAGTILRYVLHGHIPALTSTITGQVSAEWRVSTKPNLTAGLICAMIGVAVIYFLNQNGKNLPGIFILGYGVGGALLLYAAARLVFVPLDFLSSLVPKPSKAGLNDVAAQKVHGDAGYAHRNQVDAALRDQDQGGGFTPHFRD